MVLLINLFFGDLFLSGMAGAALLVVLALLWSDWAARKRERDLLAARAKSREQRLRERQMPEPLNGLTRAPGFTPASPSAARSRRLQWALALAGVAVVAAVAVLLHGNQKSMRPARAPANPAAPNTRLVSSQTHSLAGGLAASLWYTNAPSPEQAKPIFDLGQVSLWGRSEPGPSSDRITISQMQSDPRDGSALVRSPGTEMVLPYVRKPDRIGDPSIQRGLLR